MMRIYETQGRMGQDNCQNAEKKAAEYVREAASGIEEISEETRRRLEKRIRAKLEAGKRLTAKELRYLRRYNPGLYATAMRVEAKRRSMEERLRHARSKEEVEDILSEELASVSKKDAAYQYITAAVINTAEEFKKTDSYSKLPQTEEKGKKARGKGEGIRADAEEKSGMEKTVTYEFAAGAYQLAYLKE